MKTDLEKAREIVDRRNSFVGNSGSMRENIAAAVAEGIELGCQEGVLDGITKAAEALVKLHATIGISVSNTEGKP